MIAFVDTSGFYPDLNRGDRRGGIRIEHNREAVGENASNGRIAPKFVEELKILSSRHGINRPLTPSRGQKPRLGSDETGLTLFVGSKWSIEGLLKTIHVVEILA